MVIDSNSICWSRPIVIIMLLSYLFNTTAHLAGVFAAVFLAHQAVHAHDAGKVLEEDQSQYPVRSWVHVTPVVNVYDKH